MSNIAIVVGFAVMLFLPCAIALMGGREPERKRTRDLSPYSDRVVNAAVKSAPPVIEGVHIATTLEIAPVFGSWAYVPDPSLAARESLSSTRSLAVQDRSTRDVSGPKQDPPCQNETYVREPSPRYRGRVEQAELEVLRTRAIAARAQADALAAVARAAIVQAEAAAADADELESDAAEVMRETRRAA